MALLEVKDLHTYFKTKRVLFGLSTEYPILLKRKNPSIVGESGSGKSVSAMSIIKLLDSNGYIHKGEIIFNGQNLVTSLLIK